MAIIIGRDKKVKRVELADVRKGVKEKRVANDQRKEAQKAAAEAEEAAREESKASKAMENAKPVRGRKPKSKEQSEDGGNEGKE